MISVNIQREKSTETQAGEGTSAQVVSVFRSTLRWVLAMLVVNISLFRPVPVQRVIEREVELQIHTSSDLHPLFILKYPSFSTDWIFLLLICLSSCAVWSCVCLLSSVSVFKKIPSALLLFPWYFKKLTGDIFSVFLFFSSPAGYPSSPPSLVSCVCQIVLFFPSSSPLFLSTTRKM